MMHPYHYDPADPLGNMQYIDPLPENPTQEEIEEYQRIHFRAAIGYVVSLFVVLVAVAVIGLLTGCTTTKYVQVPVTHSDTVRLVTLQRDSIVRHDSIFVNRYVRGDTVFQQVERWHTQYRDRLIRDTAYLSRRDTLSVPYPVERQVAKPLTSWQTFQIWMGRMAMIALALLLALWIISKRGKWLPCLRKIF